MSEQNQTKGSSGATKERIQGFSEIEEAISKAIKEHSEKPEAADKGAHALSNTG